MKSLRLRRFTTRQTSPVYPTTSRTSSAQRETNTLTLLSSCHLRWETDSVNFFSTNTQGGPTTYNAWEEDFATLNIFFGHETVIGEINPSNEYQFSRWKSLREESLWDRLSLSHPLADSLAFSLASALSPSSRSSTGQLSGFVGI